MITLRNLVIVAAMVFAWDAVFRMVSSAATAKKGQQ